METATVQTGTAGGDVKGVGAKTIADLLPLAARAYGAKNAVLYKDDGGQWVSKTYAEVGEIVRDLSLGLIDLGIERGDKVSILANTRPEWSYFDFAALSAGATVVPIYQTNSPEECQYVLENSDARVVIVEDDEQLEKIRAVRESCPKLEHVIRMTGSSDDAISMADLAARGARRQESEWEERWRSVTADDICTFIYTSGTTGPPKGCIISHGNYRAMLDMVLEVNVLGDGEVTYLFLPLAHSLRAADPARHLRPRRDARLLGARPAEDHPQPRRGEAHLLPVGAADLREDLHGRDGQRRRRPAG